MDNIFRKFCQYYTSNNDEKMLNELQELAQDEFEEYQDYKNQSISIPGMNGIYLKANQTKQTVDFFNPEENQCYFIISLYLSDGTLIYKSDYIEPGDYSGIMQYSFCCEPISE